MTTKDLDAFFEAGWNGCDVFTFRDGKIAVKSSFFKTLTPS